MTEAPINTMKVLQASGGGAKWNRWVNVLVIEVGRKEEIFFFPFTYFVLFLYIWH